MAGRRTSRHRDGRWLCARRQAVQGPVGDRQRHHRHTLEWPGLLRPQEPTGPVMNKPVLRKLRCAVYTRKSTEEGLDQAFSSLDAQRDACDAYIASQKAEGWMLVHDRY